MAEGAPKPVPGKWVKDKRWDHFDGEPTVDTRGFRVDNFFQRIMSALGGNPEDIARDLGVPANDLITRYTGTLADIDQDPFWITLANYVDRRIGEMISVREELQRSLNADRKARLAERLRMGQRR